MFTSGTFRSSIGASLGLPIDALLTQTVLRVVLPCADVEDAFFRASATLVAAREGDDTDTQRAPGVLKISQHAGESNADAPRSDLSLEVWREGERAWCDLRATVTRPAATPLPALAPPPALIALAREPGLADVRALGAPLRTRESPGDDVVSLLRDAHRRLPIIAVSEPFALDVDALCARLGPLAHVVALGEAASWTLTRELGKLHSTYLGAVRVYPAGYGGSGDDNSVLYLPDTIRSIDARARLSGTDTGADGAFIDVLVRQVLARVTASFENRPFGKPPAPAAPASPARLRSTPRVAQPDVDTTSEHAHEIEARIVKLERAVSEAHGAAARARADAEEFYASYLAVVAERDRLRDELAALMRGEVDLSGFTGEGAALVRGVVDLVTTARRLAEREALATADAQQLADERDALRRELGRERLRPASVPRAEDDAIPATLPGYDDPDGFAEYVRARYGDALVLHPRAVRAFAEGGYDDLQRVYDALDLLAGEYRAMRRDGGPAARERYEARRDALHLRDGGAITGTGRGQFRELYEVDYDGRRRAIDEHLRSRSNSFDPRRVLAIYFFWDAQREAAVVCSLPRHLDNARTT